MSPIILRTATRYLTPLLLLFSAFLLWRGHHEPGGGFVGGLVAASAFMLVALAEGVPAARRALRVPVSRLVPMGVATSLASGLPALLVGRPFMTGLWWKDGPLPVGTPLLFDVGVYLTVLGVVLGMLLALLEDASGDERPEVTPPARPENGG